METTGLDLRHGCKPFMVSTCTSEGEVHVWEWPVDPITRQPDIPRNDKLEIEYYLEGSELIFHHAKFDIRAFETIGMSFLFTEDQWWTADYLQDNLYSDHLVLTCRTFQDTLLASHACSSSDIHGLKELGVKYLRYSDADKDELKKAVAQAARDAKARNLEVTLGQSLTGKRATDSDYWLPRYVNGSDACLRYAGGDVERTVLLWDVFKNVLDEKNLWYGYDREKRLLSVVYKTENGGLSVHRGKLDAKLVDLEQKSERLLRRCRQYAVSILGRKCNLNSPKDLQELLYKKLKVPIPKTTTQGQPSVDKASLESILESFPSRKKTARQFISELLLARSYQTGMRYLKNYLSYGVEDDDGYIRLYPSLNQSGTHTTRFSSSNPNGQNCSAITKVEIGGETYEGTRIRDVFAPPPGKIWYAIDYSQLELRVFAAASQEPSLIEALNEGYDFHDYVSTRLFEKPLEEITKQERRIAKNTNFAIIFGAGPQKVDATAGMPGAYKLFCGLFPNVHSYMRKIINQVSETGYVYTLDGYRLDIPLRHPYKAVNYLVQGTAGSIIKNAMIAMDRDGLVNWKTSRIVLQIHDELLLEFDKDGHQPRHVYAVMQAMEQAGADLGIHTPVSCDRIESDWGHGEKVIVRKTKIVPIKKSA